MTTTMGTETAVANKAAADKGAADKGTADKGAEAAVADKAAADEAAKIKLSKEDKTKLFEQYEKHDADVKAAEAKVNAATVKRSEIVKQISEKVGKGPFKWKGEELSISKRGEKFFFRGRGTHEVEDIG